MCGILGISVPKVTAQDIILFEAILRELRIRGLHATGMSWLEGGVIQTIKEPIGADRFLEKYSLVDCVEGDGSLNLIAHTRYSTSDLHFNQPIADSTLSIVHNGVISQELPENWPKLYRAIGICETSNDTELLFRTVQALGDPLIEWADSSIAALELHWDGTLRAYRNGRRPLYMSHIIDRGIGNGYKGYIFTSTIDALKRADSDDMIGDIVELPSNVYHSVSDGIALSISPAYIQGAVDLQRV